MTIRARFTLDGTTPLARTRIGFNRSRINPDQVHLTTEANGATVIDRDNAPGGIRVDAFAANPVVEVVTGRLNNNVRERITGVTDTSTQTIATVANRPFFVIAETARRIYNQTFRLFTRFPSESPTGSLDSDPARHIRVKFPEQTLSTTSFTDPHGFPSGSPVIHLEASIVATTPPPVGAAFGTLIPAQLEGHLVSELAHALHFQSLPIPLRKSIRKRYLAALGIDGIEDGPNNIGWSTDDADTQISAFLEALDEFANLFHQTPGTTLAARQASFFAPTGRGTTYAAAVTGRGRDVPGAVCATIFVRYAADTAVGLDAALNQYFNSQATTYREFERFIHRTFGVGSPQEVALSAAAGMFGV